MNAVNLYEKERNLKKVARPLKLTRAALRKWIKNMSLLRNVRYKSRRSNLRSGRVSFFPEMEQELNQYIERLRSNNATING